MLVALAFPRLRRVFEFVALLPISIPAIVLVVGLTPIYLQIGRTLGTGAWTLAFAYGILVLPFAYRSIQASIDAIDITTLSEAARTLGAGWGSVLLRVIVPNLRQGLLAAALISVAVVLGEFTIASLLNRQTLQTALVVVNKQDGYVAAIFTLLALAFAFVLLLIIGRVGRIGAGPEGRPHDHRRHPRPRPPRHRSDRACAERELGSRAARVVKDYGSTRVLHGVDLDVAPGEFVSLLGPSGCGKTTALRCSRDSSRPSAGGAHRRVAMSRVCRRTSATSAWCSSRTRCSPTCARSRTRRSASVVGRGTAEARRRAGDALDLVGLGHLADRYAHQMSGGQQQRVALARALVTEPRVLLLDEPLSALDAKVRVQLRDEIRRIQQRLGTTTVFVTHDQEEALAVSDRVAVMGAGRILQVGSPEELYTRPANAEVAAFVGSSSLVPGVVTGATVEVWGRRLPLLAAADEGPCEVFVRPENVRLVGAGEEGTDAVVEQTTFLGSIRRSLVATAEGSHVHVQHGADLGLAVGARVRVRLDDIAVLTRPVAG